VLCSGGHLRRRGKSPVALVRLMSARWSLVTPSKRITFSMFRSAGRVVRAEQDVVVTGDSEDRFRTRRCPDLPSTPLHLSRRGPSADRSRAAQITTLANSPARASEAGLATPPGPAHAPRQHEEPGACSVRASDRLEQVLRRAVDLAHETETARLRPDGPPASPLSAKGHSRQGPTRDAPPPLKRPPRISSELADLVPRC
jgi:hypothetical protein